MANNSRVSILNPASVGSQYLESLEGIRAIPFPSLPNLFREDSIQASKPKGQRCRNAILGGLGGAGAGAHPP